MKGVSAKLNELNPCFYEDKFLDRSFLYIHQLKFIKLSVKKKFEKRANTISSQTPEGIIDLIVKNTNELKLSKFRRKQMHKLDVQWYILQKQTNLIIIIRLAYSLIIKRKRKKIEKGK